MILLACSGPIPNQAAAQTVRRDDYRINDEDYATDATTQMLPDIASGVGGFTAVWQETGPDFRTTVMARRFDESGNALDGKFRVSEDTAMESIYTAPRVARHFPSGVIGDPVGSFAVVWNNWEPVTGNGTVLAQVYQLDGDPVGRNFQVDPEGAGGQYEPAIGMDPSGPGDLGSFVVTWSDRSDRNDIMARRFDGDGSPAGEVFRVNDDTSRLSRGRVAIALGGSLGGFVIVWEESDQYVNGLRRVMGRVFKGNGTPVGNAFRVDSLVRNAFAPSVAIGGDGSFVVAYETVINGQEDLRVQRFDPDGERDGAPMAVEGIDGQNQRSPDIAMMVGRGVDGYGFVLTWEDTPLLQVSGELYMQMFGGDGEPNGAAVRVARPAGSSPESPAIATIGYGNVNPAPTRSFIVWHDSRQGSLDIWGATFDMTSPNGPNFRINNTDVGGAAQIRSAVDATPTGMQVVVWGDDRESQANPKVYGKRLGSDGSPLGADFVISDQPNGYIRPEPDVVVFPDSSFVAVWTGSGGTSGRSIMLQRFDGANNRIGTASIVGDPASDADAPAIAGNAAGSFVVVWRDYGDPGQIAIRGRLFDADAEPLGAGFRVDTDRSGSGHGAPAVAMFPDGRFLVVWADERDGDYNIWAQEFDAEGDRVGLNVRVNSAMPEDGQVQMSPAVAAAPGGLAMIAWLDYRAGARRGDIQAQLYDRSGRIGGNIRVNDRDTTARPLCLECEEEPPSVAAMKQMRGAEGDNSFVVAWCDFENGESATDIDAQLFDETRPVGRNIQVTSGPGGSSQRFPDVARDGLQRNGLYFTWDDDRNISREGLSIWGRILEWIRGTSSVTGPATMSDHSVRIHPSPAGHDAQFTFTLAESETVSLEVYTSTGERVVRIEKGVLSAGEHAIHWDAAAAPAGIYLYRLQSGDDVASGSLVVRR